MNMNLNQDETQYLEHLNQELETIKETLNGD